MKTKKAKKVTKIKTKYEPIDNIDGHDIYDEEDFLNEAVDLLNEDEEELASEYAGDYFENCMTIEENLKEFKKWLKEQRK